MIRKLLVFTFLISLPCFSQDNASLINFNIEDTFNNNKEAFDIFINENKTNNAKPIIINNPIIRDGYIEQEDYLYDNLNNAYSISYKDSDNIGYRIFSIQEYNQENNTWIEIINNEENQSIFYEGAKIIGINKNSNNEYFTRSENRSLLVFSTFVSVFAFNNSTNFRYCFGFNIDYGYGADHSDYLYFVNDYFYKTNDYLKPSITFEVEKSNNTNSIILSNDIISTTPVTLNIEFENGKFLSQEFTITTILTPLGQKIPNKNLEKNVIYIIVVSNDKGQKYSIKIIAN